MQKNKLIGCLDLSNFNNHFIEVLLLAYIWEKQLDQLTVFDLNNIDYNLFLKHENKHKKEADLTTFKLFDRCLYQILSNSALKQNKAINLLKHFADKNENLLLSLSLNENNLNKEVVSKLTDLILFVDITSSVSNKLINFFMNNNVKEVKSINVIVYNYVSNINNEKELISIRKMLNQKNISILTIDKIPSVRTLKEVESIEPWNDLYKVIKKII